MPADARREPPSEARHGHGRPPDGPPDEEPWGFARGFRSLFQWPQQNTAAQALPPLTSIGLRARHEHGHHDGGVHRPIAPVPGLTQANDVQVPVEVWLNRKICSTGANCATDRALLDADARSAIIARR